MSSLKGKEGVCRIEVSRVDWIVLQPWQRTQQTKATGSGFVIDGERILTNAHVVKAAVDIRVRPSGSTRRFLAKVLTYAPDVDLALLVIAGDKEKTDFFSSWGGNGTEGNGSPQTKRPRKSFALEFADDLPALQESVHVVGYPTGGTTICVTEGVVSRIDLTAISTFNMMLAIQVDSAVNPGNSGGPAFNKEGKVTGVAFRKKTGTKSKSVDNIGYLIPAKVVKAFLRRCNAKGTYTLSPAMPYRWHPLENKSLRLAHAVPDSIHGVLLTSVCPSFEDILQKGDVLTKIDDKAVADDGQVILRGTDELVQHAGLLLAKHVDEPVVFSVYRDGKEIACAPPNGKKSVILRDIPTIVRRWKNVDLMPEYLILGALVMLPFSWPLRSESKCGLQLQSAAFDWYKRWPSEWEGNDALVILVDVFSHELSFSYIRPWRRVVKYNGVIIRSLKHLQELWQASCDSVQDQNIDNEEKPTFARIELENDDDVVFEVKTAIHAQEEILRTHQIAKSFQIIDGNPKYNLEKVAGNTGD
mmetsp:Transcript_24501/g.67832  ORF Transcript_24501/g.67832 Transcript_24501/m.67832 type:complete len:528 (+) Transcript_24501:175-1758(+)